MRTLTRAAAVALALLPAVGCSPSPPKPAAAHASLVVAADVNPDATGRPSPVVLRLYELKEEGAFNDADYFALFDKEREILGPSLVAREEYELQPGETRSLDLKIPPEVRFIGATVGFRDIRNAKWRTLAPVPQATSKVVLSIARAEVAITVAKK
jgi:type VI secretion system protein VasD